MANTFNLACSWVVDHAAMPMMRESLLTEKFWSKGMRIYFSKLGALEMLFQHERNSAIKDRLACTSPGMNVWPVF
jgi:hypothetical protein